MVSVGEDIKNLLVIPSKSRYDTLTDQYNRILMVKLLLVCSVVMGCSWYKDSINCIIPEGDLSENFVSAACWVQGLYVYKEVQGRMDEVAYFGMPINMDDEGLMDGTHTLCIIRPRLQETPNVDCKPMTKTFYLQYQWMPFLIGALAVIYYAPYIAFRYANSDMIALKDSLKCGNNNVSEGIAKNFFNIYKPNTRKKKFHIIRGLMAVVCKILYLLSNIVSLLILDAVLNGEYISYGFKWFQWSQLENSMAYDYMGARNFPKPGNFLLPPFGYCELYESSKDIKVTLANRHKFVCELSQHILYQYCLYVLWIAIFIGIILTMLGVMKILFQYSFSYFGVRNGSISSKKMLSLLSLREIEYLEFIQRKDVCIYEEIMEKLRGASHDNISNPPENINRYPKDTYLLTTVK